MRAFPPNRVTRNTKKGKTMLNPRVPMKFIKRMGNIEIDFFPLSEISDKTVGFHLNCIIIQPIIKTSIY